MQSSANPFLRFARRLGKRLTPARYVALGGTPFYRKYPYRGPLKPERIDPLAIVDPGRAFLYNRIAKAANSTIVAELSRLLLSTEASDAKRALLKSGAFLKPSQLSEAQVDDLPRFFKFTFVRNPYSRVLSAYLNKVVFRGRAPRDKNGGPVSFPEFCDWLDRGGLLDDKHWTPQTLLVVLPVASFDFIGRVENFDRDFDFVLGRLGLALRASIKRAGNPTGANEKLQQYYDESSRRTVARLYKADFDAFGYDVDDYGLVAESRPVS